MKQCDICGKWCKPLGLASHKKMAHTEEGKHQLEKARTSRKFESEAWNKGLTKHSDIRVQKNTIALNKAYSEGRHKISEEKRKLLSTLAKQRKLGGYTKGGGRGKSGWYKGIWCDSSWELAWVMYQIDHGVTFRRNTKKFDYIFEGKIKKYIPDFLMEDGTYVEIKGYQTEVSRAKIDQFPDTISIIDETSIKPYLAYAKEKYGRKFIDNYEGR